MNLFVGSPPRAESVRGGLSRDESVRGSWVLGPGSCVLGPGSCVLGPGSWVLGPGDESVRGGVPHVMNLFVGDPPRDQSVRGGSAT